MDTGSYEYETYADEWSASVTAYLVLDGIRTSVTANVGFGENAAITWAGGFLGTPVRGDDYPLIGVQGGIDRLNAQSAMWAQPGVLSRDATTSGIAVNESSGASTEIAPAVAPDAPVPPDSTYCDPACPAPADTVLGSDTIPTDTMPVDQIPTDQIPLDTTPVVVTFTGVHASLEQMWGADGTVWLLPGYQFDASDGGWYSVTAVEDQYIQQPDPLTDIATVEGTGAATPVVDSYPAVTDTVVGDPATDVPAGTESVTTGG